MPGPSRWRIRASASSPFPKHLITRGIYMNRFSLVAISLIVLAAISATASPNPSTAKVPTFPGTLANARYVYVASYDGDQFDRNLLPEDREAISAVQDSIQKWGKADTRVPALRRRHHHSRDEPTLRRSDGRVRCTSLEWQFSLARHGTRRPPVRRN